MLFFHVVCSFVVGCLLLLLVVVVVGAWMDRSCAVVEHDSFGYRPGAVPPVALLPKKVHVIICLLYTSPSPRDRG